MRRLLALLASLLGLALAPAAAHAFTFYDWDVTASAGAQPMSIAVSGSTLYFTLSGTSDIGRLTTSGVAQSRLPGADATSRPQSLTLGPDGSTMWFADPADDAVGRVDPATGVAEPQVANVSNDPWALTVGHNGAVWGIEKGGNGALFCFDPSTPGPTAAPYGLGYAGAPVAVATATDGAIWFADTATNKLGRAVPGPGCSPPAITTYDFAAPAALAAAGGGDMYVASAAGLASVHANGASLTTTPVVGLGTSDVTAMHDAADGSAWYVDGPDGRIGRVTGSAVAVEYALPRTMPDNPTEFTFTADKALWFTGSDGTPTDLIGRFSEETGLPGQDGQDGTNGADGTDGRNGAQGPAGPQGAGGAAGAQGVPGLRGGTGPQGPQGERGKRGKTGVVSVPRIKCKLSGTKVTCKVVSGSGGNGGGSVGGGESRVHLSLQRGGRVYARATREATGTRDVRLRSLRRVRTGRYTLVVRLGHGVTVRMAMRI